MIIGGLDLIKFLLRIGRNLKAILILQEEKTFIQLQNADNMAKNYAFKNFSKLQRCKPFELVNKYSKFSLNFS